MILYGSNWCKKKCLASLILFWHLKRWGSNNPYDIYIEKIFLKLIFKINFNMVCMKQTAGIPKSILRWGLFTIFVYIFSGSYFQTVPQIHHWKGWPNHQRNSSGYKVRYAAVCLFTFFPICLQFHCVRFSWFYWHFWANLVL